MPHFYFYYKMRFLYFSFFECFILRLYTLQWAGACILTTVTSYFVAHKTDEIWAKNLRKFWSKLLWLCVDISLLEYCSSTYKWRNFLENVRKFLARMSQAWCSCIGILALNWCRTSEKLTQDLFLRHTARQRIIV